MTLAETMHENGAPNPSTSVDGFPQAALPAHVAAALIQIALRTEPGQAYWAGYAAALAQQYPWMMTGPVAFRPGAGFVQPAPAQNGKG